jgi:hypothetical protein
MKQLDNQTEYNVRDGFSLQLHEYSLKKLGLDYNKLDTEKSNELLELMDEVIAIMHDSLRDRLEEFANSVKNSNAVDSVQKEKSE